MELVRLSETQLGRRRLATLTGCFAMHSGSGETLLPEVGATSSPPPAGTEAARDKNGDRLVARAGRAA